MSFFIPASAGFKTAALDRTSARYWKLLIDTNDDDVLEDVTSYISNNSISISGKRTGSNNEAVSNTASVTLRNSGQWFSEGDFSGALCAIEAKIGVDNEYIRVFTGYVDDQGCRRDKKFLNGDTIQISFVDRTKKSAKRKASPIIYTGFSVCDPDYPATSLVHAFSAQLGIAAADIDCAKISYIVPWVYLDDTNKLWDEFQKLASQYLGLLTFRYDGKLRFHSRFEDAYTAPTSEYIFDDSNIHLWSAELDAALCTRAKTEFNAYKLVGSQIIFKDTTNYNSYTKQIDIEVAAGAYYPGPGTLDVAQLKYADPQTGEEFAYCTDIVTPTIGAVGSGAAIECEGGIITLESFNGSTAATKETPDHAEIILYNGTGATIHIRKLEITGTAYIVEKAVTVIDEDNSVPADDVVEKTIDGTYAASAAQAHETTEWWVAWGKSSRLRYSLTVDWVPFVQEGAAVTLKLPGEGSEITCIVDSYTHPAANGPLTKQVTQLVLVSTFAFTPTGGGQTNTVTPGDSAAHENISAVSTETYNFRNNIAPTNNITDLSFSGVSNADGSTNVDINFSYTQGLVKASGFLAFYKDDLDAPDAINITSDQSVFHAATELGTSYKITLAGLPVRYGGAGAVTRHYRFAVVAVSNCAGGMIPHSDGVVELPEWIDKTFETAVLTAAEGDVSMSYEGASIVWRLISTGAEKARIRYDAAKNLLNVSQLAGLVKYRGMWTYGGVWGAESTDNNITTYGYFSLILLSDGKVLCVYRRVSDDYLVQRIRATDGTWGTESIVNAASSQYPSLVLLPDGKVLCVYKQIASPYYLKQRIRATDGTWGSESTVDEKNSGWPSLALFPDGRVLCVYQYNAGYPLKQRIRATDGTWGSESTVNAGGSFYPSIVLLPDGRVLCVYERSDNSYLVQRLRATDGTWGDESNVNAASSTHSSLVLLPDGRVLCVYERNSDHYFVQRLRAADGTWGAESIVNAVNATSPSLVLLSDGKVLCVYTYGNGYLVQRLDNSAYGSIPVADTFTLTGSGVIQSGENSYGEYQIFGCGIIHMTGWGFVTWTSGASVVSKTLTLPYEVSDPTSIRPTGNCPGYKTTDPTAINDVTGQIGLVVDFLVGASTTQITIRLGYQPSGLSNTYRVLYSFDIWARWS